MLNFPLKYKFKKNLKIKFNMRFLFKIWSAFLTSISIHACIELKKNAEEHTFCHKSQTLNIVVPMAGDDSLFRQAGFLEPKPFISLKGKKMISWVIENILPKRSIENIQKLKFHFLIKKAQLETGRFDHIFKEILSGIEFKLHSVNLPTQGAACTVLLAQDEIDNDEPLIIVNSDQFIEWDPDNFYDLLVNSSHDGIILTFNQPNTMDQRWSFVRIDESRLVAEVQEKKWISPHAAVGLYGWKKGSDFVKFAKKMILKGRKVRNEFYLCPVYNEAILDGKKIGIEICDRMWSLGYPDDLEIFRNYIERGL